MGVQLDEGKKLRGYNIQATYALTGESRNYNYQTGGFSGLTPANDSGAWELSLRHSYLKLNTEAAALNVGTSLAWTVNNNVKVLANYIVSNVDQDEAFKALNLRLQASW